MGCCLVSPAPRTAARVHKEIYVGGTVVKVAFGDLTCEEVDAVVNVTDAKLVHRGGVPGALKRAGGLEVTRECEAAIKLSGQISVAVTTAGYMPCKRLIHVSDSDLKTALELGLGKAADLHCTSLSLSGAYTDQPAAHLVVTTVLDWLAHNPCSLREVRILAWDSKLIRLLSQSLSPELPSLVSYNNGR